MNNMLQKGIQKSDTRKHNGLALVVPSHQDGIGELAIIVEGV